MVLGPFTTTTTSADPLDGRLPGVTLAGGTGAGLVPGAVPGTDTGGGGEARNVSDFVTVQSLTNFAAMTGAIAAAWAGLRQLNWSFLDTTWVPFGLALAFGVISFLVSDLKNTRERIGAGFIGFLNSLILFAAVVGATELST